MDTRYSCSPNELKTMDTAALRNEFLIQDLFKTDELTFVYSHVDRMITGGVVPVNPVQLAGAEQLKSDYFLERREMGVINIGGDGIVVADGKRFEISAREAVYLARGTKNVTFESKDSNNPAKFYINSAPAHHTHKTVAIKLDGTESDDVILVKESNRVELGSLEDSNHRVIYKYILPGQVDSCQLVMGMTTLKPGSVWNTMPTHTHERRMEVYLYFDLPEDAFVMHYMGQPTETRHIVMRNEQAVISPSWSIHSGSGSRAYTFIWGMVGENQEFSDMDNVSPKDIL